MQLGEKMIAKARMSLEQEVTPITDIRSTTEYRRYVCGALLADALMKEKSKY